MNHYCTMMKHNLTDIPTTYNKPSTSTTVRKLSDQKQGCTVPAVSINVDTFQGNRRIRHIRLDHIRQKRIDSF